MMSNAATPPTKKLPNTMISQSQKQALIDNLQLEVTERARKLRAQYALQAQGLKMRVEMRLNRIPTSLRKITMGELIERHARDESGENNPPPNSKSVASLHLQEPFEAVSTAALPSICGFKRTSNDISTDKENDAHTDLPMPKRRPKVTSLVSQSAKTRTTRAATKSKLQNSQILSPQSSNARAIPTLPKVDMAENSKTTRAYPIKKSIIDNSLPNLAAIRPKPKPQRNASRFDARQRNPSNNSHSSLSSSATILVSKDSMNHTGKLEKKGLKRKAVGVSAVGKKFAAPNEDPSSRRVLRKRV